MIFLSTKSIRNSDKIDKEEVKLTLENSSAKLIIPVNYLLNLYSLIVMRFSVIYYKKYPLLQYGSKNYHESVISIKVYNNMNALIDNVSNLQTPFEIIFKKLKSDFNYCAFLQKNNPLSQ